VPKGNVEKVNAANPAQSNTEARIGGVVVITLEQGGRIDPQAKSIGRPYNLLQFACIEITFHQYEFGLDLTREWRLSFSIERRALPRVRTSSTGRSFRPSGSLICSPSSPKRCVRPCDRGSAELRRMMGVDVCSMAAIRMLL